MTPWLSLILDAVRLLAAVTVFAGHFGTQRISGGLLYQAEWLGPVAVDVFFVLSGFVVADATARRLAAGPVDYAMRRAARILSEVVPALALTLLCDFVGLRVDPDLFGRVPRFDPAQLAVGYLASAAFVHEVWFLALQPGSNVPYWSLGFEVWYYAAFGVAVFARGWRRVAGLGVIAAVVGPKVLLLAPVWLFGVMAWWVCRLRPAGRAAGAVLVVAAVIDAVVLWPHVPTRSWEAFAPFAPLDGGWVEALLDVNIGLAFATLLVGLRWLLGVGAVPAGLAGPVRWLAGGTFGLYLLHYPLIHLLAALLPWPVASVPSRVTIGLLAPVVVLVASRRL